MGEFADMAIDDGIDEWAMDGLPDYSRSHRRRRIPIPEDPSTEWISGDMTSHLIKEMNHTHLINTIHLLERKGTAIETSKIILVSHPCYPYLVKEAIRRNLLDNPHNGIDIQDPTSSQMQTTSPIRSLLVRRENRKIDLDL